MGVWLLCMSCHVIAGSSALQAAVCNVSSGYDCPAYFVLSGALRGCQFRVRLPIPCLYHTWCVCSKGATAHRDCCRMQSLILVNSGRDSPFSNLSFKSWHNFILHAHCLALISGLSQGNLVDGHHLLRKWCMMHPFTVGFM